MASVSFEGISKIYPNGHRALSELTLEIADGERLVLVGPSGCGKSTLLRLLAGLEVPSSGVLRIGGQIANQLTPRQRNIAMVFQDYALYPTMTVRENLEFPLKMRQQPATERQRRVAWVSELLDLGELLGRLPKQLSGGQRQRVAMGRALVREPSVFLLDEPLSNLDARLRAQVRAEIASLQQRTGSTMLYVTHDQTEAMTLGQRIAVLEGGILRQVATPEVIYAHPANLVVAQFFGDPPLNLFPAVLRAGADGWLLALGEAVALPIDARPEFSALSGHVVTVGIRPEDLRFAVNAASAQSGSVPAIVETVEFQGFQTLIHLRPTVQTSQSMRWIARSAGQPAIASGDPAWLTVESSKIQVFAQSV